jgi:hypothetical protein
MVFPSQNPGMPKRSRKPRDLNQLAKAIVEQATSQESEQSGGGEAEPEDPVEKARKDAAKLLGSLGGKKGGPARAKALSKKRRQEIARKAARARWKEK